MKDCKGWQVLFFILRMESYREDCAPSNPEFTVKIVWGEVKDAKHFNHLRMDGVFQEIIGVYNTMFVVYNSFNLPTMIRNYAFWKIVLAHQYESTLELIENLCDSGD